MRVLFFDTETTGLPKNRYEGPSDSDNHPRIVQLAYSLQDESGRALHEHSFIFKPGDFEIEEGAAKVHGINKELAEEVGLNPYQCLTIFQDIVRRADKIVAHNIKFDYPVVESEFLRLGLTSGIEEDKMFCTKEASIDFCQINQTKGQKDCIDKEKLKLKILTGKSKERQEKKIANLEQKLKFKPPKLEELYKILFEEEIIQTHDALDDVRMLAKSFWELKRRGVI